MFESYDIRNGNFLLDQLAYQLRQLSRKQRQQKIQYSVKLATIVAELHNKDITHGDIRKDNFEWDASINDGHLINFCMPYMHGIGQDLDEMKRKDNEDLKRLLNEVLGDPGDIDIERPEMQDDEKAYFLRLRAFKTWDVQTAAHMLEILDEKAIKSTPMDVDYSVGGCSFVAEPIFRISVVFLYILVLFIVIVSQVIVFSHASTFWHQYAEPDTRYIWVV